MDEIEAYAVELVHLGAADCAQDDMDEDEVFEIEAEWRQACDLGTAMAKAIEGNPESFLAWFRGLDGVQ